MTNEKAIEMMEELCLHNQDICDCKNEVDCADCQIKMAIKALEKQIPKKVIDHDYCIAEYGDSGCQIGGIFCYKASCPACDNTIVDGELDKSDLMGIRYCDICGQAIDWSEDEE